MRRMDRGDRVRSGRVVSVLDQERRTTVDNADVGSIAIASGYLRGIVKEETDKISLLFL